MVKTDNEYVPCCAADALRRIRQIPVSGSMTGIVMLDECIADVKKQDPGNDSEIGRMLMKKIRVYNYVPPGAEGAYARAIMEEYQRTCQNDGTGN